MSTPQENPVFTMTGMTGFGTLESIQMVLLVDGGVELIVPAKTVTIRNGKGLVRLLRRYEPQMEDGDFKGKWHYGGPEGEWSWAARFAGSAQHYLKITIGQETRDTMVMRYPNANYFGYLVAGSLRQLAARRRR